MCHIGSLTIAASGIAFPFLIHHLCVDPQRSGGLIKVKRRASALRICSRKHQGPQPARENGLNYSTGAGTSCGSIWVTLVLRASRLLLIVARADVLRSGWASIKA